jgi:hypothetical protein
MKLALRDTFERQVTLTETLIWMGIFVGGLILFLLLSPVIFSPVIWLVKYFYPVTTD